MTPTPHTGTIEIDEIGNKHRLSGIPDPAKHGTVASYVNALLVREQRRQPRNLRRYSDPPRQRSRVSKRGKRGN